MIHIAIDIGSTWTKGARFVEAEGLLSLATQAIHPTTTHNLEEAFITVLCELLGGASQKDALSAIHSGRVSLQYSSSAKGGLAVAAIGLVPELTVALGKIAAQSAGAKLTHTFSYSLSAADIAQLKAAPPDILLFAGGTDGGNTRYVLENAEKIASAHLPCDIIYAGNRALVEAIRQRLSGYRLTITENLLPQFNAPNPEGAQAAIRTIFLNTIVTGKGLDPLIEKTGAEPMPTPRVMFEYVEAIHQSLPQWDSFMLIDMGGATTDIYSANQESPSHGVFLKGLPEPIIKRTVEGDLGMRVSAKNCALAAGETLTRELHEANISPLDFEAYLERLHHHPNTLAHNAFEVRCDALLARIAIGHAAARHAGRHSPVYTPQGECALQTGRNLNGVHKIIGSGGWLAHTPSFSLTHAFSDHTVDARGRRILLPQRFEYWRDALGLLPLIANLARVRPKAAALLGIQYLKRDEHVTT